MQIATKYFIFCVLAATIATLSSRGADTDAQTKARDALRQKMMELDAQTPVTNAHPVPAPKTKPAPEPAVTTPTPAPAPAETVKTVPPPAPTRTVEPPPTRTPPPAATSAPAPVVKTTPPPKQPKPAPVAKTSQNTTGSGQVTASRPDSEKVAKARQALEEKMRELNSQGSQPGVAAQPAATQPVVATQSPPRSASQPVVVNEPPPAKPVFHTPEIASTPQPRVSADTSDANEPLPTPPPVNKSATSESNKPQPSKKPTETRPAPESRPSYALPPGPPAPVSAEKVQKLNALLQQYQADRITPEQYHQERAKILAGP